VNCIAKIIVIFFLSQKIKKLINSHNIMEEPATEKEVIVIDEDTSDTGVSKDKLRESKVRLQNCKKCSQLTIDNILM
jgi:NACalpha-BTF3-like transcription factor